MVGIYMITVKDVYAYIGQSVDVDNRLKKHKRDIENKCHPNMELIGDYSLHDCKFNILLECKSDELNKKELEMYDKYSTSYIMLNKRTCGLQSINGSTLKFYDDKNPSLKYDNENFYIDEIEISKNGNMYCLSDLVLYIKNHTDFDFRINQILIKHDFIDRINAIYNLDIPKTRNTAKYLKDANIYKVVGARENKKIYCTFEVFITFAFYSCPQFAASMCIMIGDKINGNI